MYKPPIRGKSIKKTPEKIEVPNLLGNVTSVVKLVSDLKTIKEDVISKVEDKISEANDILVEIKGTVSDLKELQKGDPGKDADEELIINKVLLKIRQPKDGVSVDEDALIHKLREYIPESVDEDSLVQRIIKKIPKSKSEIRIIEKQVEVDPMIIIDKIMALPEEALKKLRLKGSNIDGYDQTISAFRNQLARGYLHGGGGSSTGGSGITRVINTISTNVIADSAANTDYVYLVSGNTTLTLPTAIGNKDLYTVKNKDGNTTTVSTTGGQTIDGGASYLITIMNDSIDIISDGANWFVV